MSGTLTWDQFLNQIKHFIELSKKFHDNWTLIEKDSSEGNSYLLYQQKIKVKLNTTALTSKPNELDKYLEEVQYDEAAKHSTQTNTEELVSLEYHIVYSISYQVPVLYFKGHKSDGSFLSLENSWQIFTDFTKDKNTKPEMLSILTQMEHPVLFRPFLVLHPCRTAEILANAPNSKNQIITFLSVMGPYVKLHIKDEYGMELK